MSNNKKNNQQLKHADTVIKNHVVWSMGAGMIPFFGADILGVIAMQVDMIRQLCNVYNVDFEETQGKALVTSITSSTLARVGARSVVKLIPGIGSVIGGVAVSVFSGASTYALGEVFKKHFESGGTILDFDTERLKKFYKEKFEKGKQFAKDIKESQDTSAPADAQADNFDIPASPSSEPVAQEAPSSPPPPKKEPKADKSGGIIGKLKELADLKTAGALSAEEFETMKKKLIDEF